MLLVVLNVLVSLFLLGSTTLGSFLFWVKMSFVGGALGIAWLVFTLRYDGRSLRDVTRVAALVAIEPAAVFALAWFNDLHHLLWTRMTAMPITTPGSLLHVETSFGPSFWVWNIYQYVLLLWGVVVLMRGMFHAPSTYRGQTIAVLVAMAVPWTANILFLIGRTPVTGVDLTPFAFALSSVALFFALYRFRFLDLVPIPRSLIVEANPNGVLVLDGRGRVVDINAAAERILVCTARDVLGVEGTQVLPALSPAASGTDAELVFVLSLVAGRRGFCHHACWMAPFMMIGRGVRNIIHLPAVQLRADTPACVACHACTTACPMSLEVQAMVLSRQMENSECILCGTCVDVCPHNVIRYDFGRPHSADPARPVKP